MNERIFQTLLNQLWQGKPRHLVTLSPCLLVLLSGCRPTQAQNGALKPPPPEVSVSAAVTETVQDYEDFPGRMEAVNSVEMRARVTGYLDKVHFQEGSLVKKKDLLFEIDPRPYENELARAEGTIVQTEGQLKRLEADIARASTLLGSKNISREEYDRIAGDRVVAAGALEVAKADQKKAKLNLSWTKVHSPLTGRISRRFIDPGNLVKADETILTTIVDLDPIYANFDLDERTALRFQALVRAGKISWSLDAGLPVLLGLADEEGFPRQGKINFADNKVDPDTGTWRMRAHFKNADHALSPGLFVRIRLPIGNSYQATLVSEQALGTDQGQKFVYVVDDDNKVAYRRVKVGLLHHGLRVITEGLAKGEKVIVSGLQRARPGIEVTPLLVPMPSSDKE